MSISGSFGSGFRHAGRYSTIEAFLPGVIAAAMLLDVQPLTAVLHNN
jgi:hypothetical protein